MLPWQQGWQPCDSLAHNLSVHTHTDSIVATACRMLPAVCPAGLVFVPLSQPYLHEYGDDWITSSPRRLVDKALNGLMDKPGQQIIVMSQVLVDDINTGYQQFQNLQVGGVVAGLRGVPWVVGPGLGHAGGEWGRVLGHALGRWVGFEGMQAVSGCWVWDLLQTPMLGWLLSFCACAADWQLPACARKLRLPPVGAYGHACMCCVLTCRHVLCAGMDARVPACVLTCLHVLCAVMHAGPAGQRGGGPQSRAPQAAHHG